MTKPNDKKYPLPTLAQSIAAWHIVCDLVELGYPHNFQREMPHIRNYMYKVSDLVDRAMAVKKGIEEEAA